VRRRAAQRPCPRQARLAYFTAAREPGPALHRASSAGGGRCAARSALPPPQAAQQQRGRARDQQRPHPLLRARGGPARAGLARGSVRLDRAAHRVQGRRAGAEVEAVGFACGQRGRSRARAPLRQPSALRARDVARAPQPPSSPCSRTLISRSPPEALQNASRYAACASAGSPRAPRYSSGAASRCCGGPRRGLPRAQRGGCM